MSEYIFNTNDADFENDVLKSEMPVLVDFWAPWCQPCRSILPIIENFAKEQSGRLRVYKVNVDENSGTTEKYGVMGIPSLLVFKEGNMVANHVGVIKPSQLLELVEPHL